MMDFKFSAPPEETQEVCDDSSVYRMLSVQLDATNLPSDFKLPKLCPIAVDWSARTAQVCKRARIFADVASNGVSIKVANGHPFVVGDVIGNTTIGKEIVSITAGDGFDTIKVEATLGALSDGDVLSEIEAITEDNTTTYVEVASANHLCYNRKLAINGDGITPVGQAYMIVERNLTVPVSKGDKQTLTSRFMFI